MTTIFLATTEDADPIGAAADLETAQRMVQEYAQTLDCEAGEFHSRKGYWHTTCYANDPDGLGFFDVTIETINFYPAGTVFPAQIVDPNFADLPNWLRRQAE